VFVPQSVADRGIAEGLQDIEEGRVHGPYRTAAEAMNARRIGFLRPNPLAPPCYLGIGQPNSPAFLEI